jgi:hypothetical protein
MSRLRFSIAGLLVFILAAALGLAALSRPSCLWASATFSLLLLFLTVALIGALYRRGHKRAFWTGFLTCGSLYVVLSLAPWFDSHVGPRLITTAMLDLLYPKVPLLQSTTSAVNDPWVLWTGSPPDYSLAHPRVGFNVSTTDEFLLIGHSLFGLLIAFTGGLLTRYFNEDRALAE